MNTIKKALLGTLLWIGAFSGGQAAQAAPINLLNFQISGLGVFSGGGPSAYFVHGAWTPSISLGALGVRGELGVTSLAFGAGDRFIATNLDVMLQMVIVPFLSLEVGPGLHTWHGQVPTSLAMTGQLVVTSVPGVDRVFLGYTRFTGGQGANQVRAGLGFDL